MDFVSKVEALMPRYQFSHYGFTPLTKPLSMDIYRAWIEAGHHGEMDYLAEHIPMKEDPLKFAPKAKSALVVAKAYYPHPYARKTRKLRTALYAHGDDYHHRFIDELEDLAKALQFDFPSQEFLCFTDSAPILERDLAYRAGLGWIGKNTCVIHPQKGSMFFIGQILTAFDVNASAPMGDFCGTCDRCITACPTSALEPRKLDATKCISYWNIESKADAPVGLRPKFGDWFFGCDICQTVCPWNEKLHGREKMRSLSEPQESSVEDLRWILTSTNRALVREFASSPILRARPRGLKRNALMVIGNKRLSELRPEVVRYLDDPHLKEIAVWTLAQLS